MEKEVIIITIQEEKVTEPDKTKVINYEELDEQLMQTFPASDPLSYY